MDAAYLESTVAAALVQGLASVVENQPEDSVEFLGKFLIKFADNELALAKVNECGVGGVRLLPWAYSRCRSRVAVVAARVARAQTLQSDCRYCHTRA